MCNHVELFPDREQWNIGFKVTRTYPTISKQYPMSKGSPQPMPGPSNVRYLSGSQPGILDPTQPSRLLRCHDAKLSFAAFDPLTACCQASSSPSITPLNAEYYRPRRVVIETVPSGECTWRFVPSAKRESGTTDEGLWPRVVDLCG